MRFLIPSNGLDESGFDSPPLTLPPPRGRANALPFTLPRFACLLGLSHLAPLEAVELSVTADDSIQRALDAPTRTLGAERRCLGAAT
jgi:hypothetical protein